MPTLNIEGRKIKVDDAFLSLSPDEQNAAVEEIAGSLGGQPAQSDRDKYYSSGIFAGEGNPLGSIARTLDASARGIQSGVTFGFDEEMGLADRAEKEAIRRESPVASTIGEIAGGLGLGGVAAKGGLSLLQGAKATLGSLAGRGAAEGAIYGGLYGSGEAEGGIEKRLSGAAYGAATGAALGAGAGGIARIGARGNVAKGAPSVEQIKQASTAAYQAADNAGVMFRPQGLQRISRDITDSLAEFGYHPKLQPRVAIALDELNRISQGNVTLKGLEQFRKIVNNAGKSADASERMIGGKIVEALDDFVLNTRPGEIMVGNVRKGGEALRRARALWHRASKAKTIETTFENASLDAASSGSGGNAENAARQGIKRILKSPSKSRGFTAAEKEAMDAFVRGPKGQNIARLVGKLSPQGNGLMLGLGGYGVAQNPLLAALPLAGFIAKKIATRGSKANQEFIEALVRSGGNVAGKQLSGGRKAIADALMRSGIAVAQ